MNIQEIISKINELDISERAELIKICQDDMAYQNSDIKFNQSTSNNYKCPHCSSTKTHKNGTNNNIQRFRCKTCKKTYSLHTNTVFHSTKKDLAVWKEYIKLMFRGLSLRDIADEMDISVVTAFYWRHKIMGLFNSIEQEKLSGVVEADETFFRLSFKGQKKDMPREPKKRGESAKKRGLSREQVCVACVVDRNKISMSKSICLGKVSTKVITGILGDNIADNSVLVTDGEKAYINYAKENGIKLKQAKDSRVIDEIYHIQTVNSFHSGLKQWIRRFRGVATKHLDSYLKFYQMDRSYSMEKIFELCIDLHCSVTIDEINGKTMSLT